jgi:hypothetical protein
MPHQLKCRTARTQLDHRQLVQKLELIECRGPTWFGQIKLGLLAPLSTFRLLSAFALGAGKPRVILLLRHKPKLGNTCDFAAKIAELEFSIN